MGDSHVRNCAVKLQQTLDQRYEVMGIAKPGAQTSDIIETLEKEIATYSRNDSVILWTGANEVSKNNTKGALKSLTKFMKENKSVNILLIDSPHRYDLMPTSCVNKEIVKFNRQLKKIMKLYSNVKLLEAKLQRKHFTRHGQNLNNSGKEFVSTELAKIIEQQQIDEETMPIQLRWIEDYLSEGNLKTHNDKLDIVELPNNDYHVKANKLQDKKDKVINKMTLRNRKVPVLKTNDFLG
jgi:hypothetical protein